MHPVQPIGKTVMRKGVYPRIREENFKFVPRRGVVFLCGGDIRAQTFEPHDLFLLTRTKFPAPAAEAVRRRAESNKKAPRTIQPTLYSIKAHTDAVPLYFGKGTRPFPLLPDNGGARGGLVRPDSAETHFLPAVRTPPRFQPPAQLSDFLPPARGYSFPARHIRFSIVFVFPRRSGAERCAFYASGASFSPSSFPSFRKRFPTRYSASAAFTISELKIFLDSRYAITVSFTSV